MNKGTGLHDFATCSYKFFDIFSKPRLQHPSLTSDVKYEVPPTLAKGLSLSLEWAMAMCLGNGTVMVIAVGVAITAA